MEASTLSVYGYTPMTVYFTVLAMCLGACMGSFLNCAAYRIVRGESFLKGHSRCTSCGHDLGIRDLVPVLSWILLRGKCRYCGAKVSVRYPLTELAFAALTVVCLLRFDLTVLCLRNYVFICVLFLLTLTDIEDMTIPDGCHIAAALAWVCTLPFISGGWSGIPGYALSRIAAAFVFGGGLLAVSLALDRITGRDTLGGGDIKLFAVCGLYLGIIGTLFTVMLACIAGLIYNYTRRNTDSESAAFPFGPWIAGAAVLMLICGEPLISWYMGLLA